MILINFHLVLFASTPSIAGRMFSLSFIISPVCYLPCIISPVCSLAFIISPYNIDWLLVIIKHTSHDVWECISVSEQRPTKETWIDKDWWQQDDIIEYKKVWVMEVQHEIYNIWALFLMVIFAV